MLRQEIEKLFLSSAISAVEVQIAAIHKSLDMCSNKIDKFIPPKQRFCATLYDDINRNQHLEVMSKLGSVAVFLTKVRNRGLPTKALTSGPGIIFTYKDLNECIHDFCADIMQFGEKSLKLRTDAMQKRINQLTEIIQFKDLQLDSLKLRSVHVFDNIKRITNSKVFEQGNTLVFALDKAMRMVRFYQEHITTFESELKQAIRAEFRDMLSVQK